MIFYELIGGIVIALLVVFGIAYIIELEKQGRTYDD